MKIYVYNVTIDIGTRVITVDGNCISYCSKLTGRAQSVVISECSQFLIDIKLI